MTKVVYVDRQGTHRRLTDEGHHAVLDTLRDLELQGKIIFSHGRFGKSYMTVPKQMISVMDADVSFFPSSLAIPK